MSHQLIGNQSKELINLAIVVLRVKAIFSYLMC